MMHGLWVMVGLLVAAEIVVNLIAINARRLRAGQPTLQQAVQAWRQHRAAEAADAAYVPRHSAFYGPGQADCVACQNDVVTA